MLNFCTLFDKNYMSRGIAMYRSLLAHGTDFHIYMFPFDDECDQALRKMNLKNVTVVSQSEFEDEKLTAVKPTRTKTEYCWTCTSSIILFCLEKYKLQNCIYVDADLYFYRSPQVLVDEKPDDYHVIITSHRYTRYYDKSKVSGKYCVQFMYFDHTEKSLNVLRWWRDRCIEWCYNRVEDGKFGDQKYLDDWTTRFEGVWDLQHPGGGLAPWNIQQYWFESTSKGIEKKTGNVFVPVFYHFHGIKFYGNGKVIYAPNSYYISRSVKSIFYEPYIEKLSDAKSFIEKFSVAFDSHGTLPSTSYFKDKYVKGMISYVMNNFIKRIL